MKLAVKVACTTVYEVRVCATLPPASVAVTRNVFFPAVAVSIGVAVALVPVQVDSEDSSAHAYCEFRTSPILNSSPFAG